MLDETSSKEKQAKERKIIKEEVEAATALLIAGKFEHKLLNDNAAIIFSEKKEPRATKRASIDSLHGLQKNNAFQLLIPSLKMV